MDTYTPSSYYQCPCGQRDVRPEFMGVHVRMNKEVHRPYRRLLETRYCMQCFRSHPQFYFQSCSRCGADYCETCVPRGGSCWYCVGGDTASTEMVSEQSLSSPWLGLMTVLGGLLIISLFLWCKTRLPEP
jgi:hypothetical protein